MFGFSVSSGSNTKAVMSALHRSLAIIEFDPGGMILSANQNFCQGFGYRVAEIEGQHHCLFVEPGHAVSPDYVAFWDRLGRGEHEAREDRCLGKNGRRVWTQATYSPVLNSRGRVVKIIEIARFITPQKLASSELEGKLEAFSRVHAIVEFKPDGTIVTANEGFLRLVDYRLNDIVGRHHRMFVAPALAVSLDYEEFWRDLQAGKPVSASFTTIGRNEREIAIQSSFVPILGLDGSVTKILEIATDMTALRQIGAGLSRLAGRKLDVRIEETFEPDFEHLRLDFNQAHETLRSTLMQIGSGTSAIETSTEDLTTTSEQLALRIDRQARSLQRATAALGQIAGMAKTTADDTGHVRHLGLVSDAEAKRSHAVAQQAVQAMETIVRSTADLKRIVEIVDAIALQTDLLAFDVGLNAARNDDAGPKFATVAADLRTLAGRCADAAKDLRILNLASTRHVNHGARLVAETDESVGSLAGQVAGIGEKAKRAEVAAKAQAHAIQDVKGAVDLMALLAEHIVSLARDTAETRRFLSTDVSHVSSLIRRFKLGIVPDNDADDDDAADDAADDASPWREGVAERRRPTLFIANDRGLSFGKPKHPRGTPVLTLVHGMAASRAGDEGSGL